MASLLLSCAVTAFGTAFIQNDLSAKPVQMNFGTVLTFAAGADEDWYTLSEDGRSVKITLPQEIEGAAWSARISDDQALIVEEQQSSEGALFVLSSTSVSQDETIDVRFEDYLEDRDSILSAYSLTLSADEEGTLSVVRDDPAWFILYPETNHLDVWMYTDETTGYEWTFNTSRDVIYNQDTVYESLNGSENEGYYHTCFCAQNDDWEEKETVLELIYGSGVFRQSEHVQASVRTLTLRVTEDVNIDIIAYSEAEDYQTYQNSGT